VNPLDSVGAVLDAIENYNRSIRSRTDELVGRSTATVTSIKTGVKENVIPGEVVVTIDRRILPSETAEGIDEEIQSILESIDIGEGVSLSWRRTKTFESAAIPSDSHLAEVFRKHTYEVDGISCSPWGDDASSDVRNFINDANMEAITWGPSDTDLAHRTDEYIQLNRAVLAHEILEEALRELLKTSGKEPS
jgi:succinyl-diaminopimelate desuccinylase